MSPYSKMLVILWMYWENCREPWTGYFKWIQKRKQNAAIVSSFLASADVRCMFIWIYSFLIPVTIRHKKCSLGPFNRGRKKSKLAYQDESLSFAPHILCGILTTRKRWCLGRWLTLAASVLSLLLPSERRIGIFFPFLFYITLNYANSGLVFSDVFS
jgi:hypothetical protein